MTIQIFSALKMREIEAFINEKHIQKDAIVEIMKDHEKGYILIYYE